MRVFGEAFAIGVAARVLVAAPPIGQSWLAAVGKSAAMYPAVVVEPAGVYILRRAR
uniref:Uncharacterized protein n=1 Tax=Marseillevirus LCMAC103 TaxID=2506604 RepID=A0A481YVX0_9VIRU|nr:MAG: hypothetical protein LCMAC103_04010 [Marseillevirus LCMAC103]